MEAIKQNKTRGDLLSSYRQQKCKIGHLQCDSQKVGRDVNRGHRIHVYLRTTFNIITEYKHSIYNPVDKGPSCSTQSLWFESQIDEFFFLEISLSI